MNMKYFNYNYNNSLLCLVYDYNHNFDCSWKAESFGGIGVPGEKVADRQYDVVLEVFLLGGDGDDNIDDDDR